MASTQKKTSDDSGAGEVQAAFDEAAEKGYFGTVPPGPPNEAYSLESGPDAPNAFEEREAAQADK